MILKRPYAFLIKYFKLINFILAILSIFIAYKTYNIVSFFNDYIIHNYSGNYYSGFYESYISSFVYFIIVLVILGISAIFLLFIYKKKPIKAYLASIINYIALIIFFNIVKNIMITLETEVITAETSRIFRDFSLLLMVPQVIFIISFLIRGLGFNIKKFNFQEDLKELEISEKDNEEVEVTFKKDGTNVKRYLRRFGREFKYYLRENKFMVVIAILIIIVISGFIIYNTLPEIVDEEYKQGEYFNIDGLKYSVKDSIITNLDYSGEIINKDLYYLVAKMYVENPSLQDIEIDYNNFRLELGDTLVYPSVDKVLNFIDYSESYTGKIIEPESNQLFLLVFEISKDEITEKNNFRLKISNGRAIKNDMQVGKFNYISITPAIIDEVKTVSKSNNGDKISFKNSNIGDSSITLSNYKITNKYFYDYDYCQNEICNTYKGIINLDYTKRDRTLLVFDCNFILNKDVPYYKVSKDVNTFLETFGKIEYLDNNEYIAKKIDAITPNNLKGKVVLEVTDKIINSSEVNLLITIRNKEYILKIK